MATYFGVNANSVSTLFGSLGSTSGTTSSSNSSGTVLSEYASIKNGSYYKLLKAYYGKYGTNSSSPLASADTKTDLTQIKSNAQNLTNAAEALYKTGAGSVFNKQKVIKTDEVSGEKTSGYDYDTDSIYKAVKTFTEEYNRVLDSTGNSDNTSILRAASNLTSMTDANKNLLSQIGITIGSDNKLAVDEGTFKSADTTTIKSLFSGTGSYAYSVSAKASNIQYTANSTLSSGQLYSSNGNYSGINTGTFYDSLF